MTLTAFPYASVTLAMVGALATATGATAQTPVLAPTTLTVAPGASVSATVSGGPNQFYAVLGSRSSSGFSYAGVNLAAGPDVAILANGSLSAAGSASVVLTPPFSGLTPDRYYVQVVTSASPVFTPLSAGASVVLRNAAVVGTLPIGGIVNPNGTLQSGSQGLTSLRTGPGIYRINFAPGLVTAPFLPMIMPIGGRVLSHFFSPTGIDLVLDADSFFHVMVFQTRP